MVGMLNNVEAARVVGLGQYNAGSASGLMVWPGGARGLGKACTMRTTLFVINRAMAIRESF